jgi:hypothetical protein
MGDARVKTFAMGLALATAALTGSPTAQANLQYAN